MYLAMKYDPIARRKVRARPWTRRTQVPTPSLSVKVHKHAPINISGRKQLDSKARALALALAAGVCSLGVLWKMVTHDGSVFCHWLVHDSEYH